MNKLKLIFIIALLINLITSCMTKSDDFKDDKFEVGQIWKYKTRQGEENSTITILKVERCDNDGIIIHIFVNGLKYKNINSPNGFSDEVGHLPLTKDAMQRSVTLLISDKNELPDFMEGYTIWKSAYENNEAGVFSVDVKDVIKYIEETINSGRKNDS